MRFFRNILVIFGASALSFGLLVPVALADTIDKNSLESVRSAYLNTFIPTLEVPNGWTGSVATCNPGTQSAAFQKATLAATNFYRSLAGVNPVTENVAQSAVARKAALMLQANGKLTHDRKGLKKCSTPEGIATFPGGATGEIALSGNVGAAGIGQYINDAGDNNKAVAHRKILLDPRVTSFGFGSVAFYDVSHSYSSSAPVTTPALVPWPSAGYFPSQMVPASRRWSVFSNGTSNLSKATVTVKKNDVALKTSVESRDSKNIVWQLDSYAAPASGVTDTYEVSLSGITGGTATFSYQVKVFKVPEVTVSELKITGQTVGRQSTVSVKDLSPADATYSYRWSVSPVLGGPLTLVGTGTSYTPVAADVGKCLVVTLDAKKTGYVPLHKQSSCYPIQKGTAATTSATVTVKPSTVNVTSVKVGKKKLTVKWNKSPATEAVTGYLVYYRVNGTAVWKYKTVAASKSSLTIKALKKGKKYDVAVAAYKHVPDTTKDLAKSASVLAGKGKKIIIKWTKVAEVAGYQVQWRLSTASSWKTKYVSFSKSSLTVKKLKAKKVYSTRVFPYTTSFGAKQEIPVISSKVK